MASGTVPRMPSGAGRREDTWRPDTDHRGLALRGHVHALGARPWDVLAPGDDAIVVVFVATLTLSVTLATVMPRASADRARRSSPHCSRRMAWRTTLTVSSTRGRPFGSGSELK
jgi:hypothetical protein